MSHHRKVIQQTVIKGIFSILYFQQRVSFGLQSDQMSDPPIAINFLSFQDLEYYEHVLTKSSSSERLSKSCIGCNCCRATLASSIFEVFI